MRFQSKKRVLLRSRAVRIEARARTKRDWSMLKMLSELLKTRSCLNHLREGWWKRMQVP